MLRILVNGVRVRTRENFGGRAGPLCNESRVLMGDSGFARLAKL